MSYGFHDQTIDFIGEMTGTPWRLCLLKKRIPKHANSPLTLRSIQKVPVLTTKRYHTGPGKPCLPRIELTNEESGFAQKTSPGPTPNIAGSTVKVP